VHTFQGGIRLIFTTTSGLTVFPLDRFIVLDQSIVFIGNFADREVIVLRPIEELFLRPVSPLRHSMGACIFPVVDPPLQESSGILV
jgi:hypothetical protein